MLAVHPSYDNDYKLRDTPEIRVQLVDILQNKHNEVKSLWELLHKT